MANDKPVTFGQLKFRQRRSLNIKRASEFRPNSAARGYDDKWRKYRAWFLAHHPLCEICGTNGRTTAATEVDHIQPLREGGTNDYFNLQAICSRCHKRKTGYERRHKGEIKIPKAN